MATLRIDDLGGLASAAGLDLAGLGGLAKLSHTEIELLARGDATKVSDATAKRLAGLLGVSVEALTGSTFEPDAPSPASGPSDEGVHMEMDAPVVERAQAARAPAAVDDDDFVDPTPPFERALNQVVDADSGRYNDDDRELLAAALHHSEIPSTVGPAQLPGLAKEWLECARTFRGARELDPMEVCLAMSKDGGRVAQLMAKRTIEKALSVARSQAAMALLK